MSKVIPTVSIYYNAQFISKPKETQHNYIMNTTQLYYEQFYKNL
jgi:hypothetical protein